MHPKRRTRPDGQSGADVRKSTPSQSPEKRVSALTVQARQRIMRDIQDIRKNPLQSCLPDFSADSLEQFTVYLEGPKDSIYEEEKFTLRFHFLECYPLDAPIVQFIPPMVPKHEHIYSNGHICLSILGDEWSPALGIRSVVMSILSMLSSSKEKKTPPDDDEYMLEAPSNPQETQWDYHDAEC
ncbi:putative Ubiquitin-conjugating enzyme E2 W [Blattamonas nauphoetae]|uniref:Ubiquitin-conjugating enzyme E2 W n=1 Tax=Blattamonas nauphoetae TaxID=2049346 RepID=A0ABQ9YLA9_9EUKA|nr:putative Ubiquitin-conjugating enzyme E2 W [Blattamonas nauphoetae]